MADSEDLFAKLTVLHYHVERELQGVVTAVSDLGVDERPTRTLHAILTRARERIQTALARQRILLWKFSMESNPAVGHTTSVGHTNSAEGETMQLRKGLNKKNGLEELAVGSILPPQDRGAHTRSTCANIAAPCRRWPHNSNKNDGGEGFKVKEELEWKRDTLLRMKYLLQRKACHHSANEADREALTRDIRKITQALEQVRRQTNDDKQKRRTCATAPNNSSETTEEGCNCKKNAGATGVEPSSTSARSTCPRGESARGSATCTTSGSGTTSRCGSVAHEQPEKEVATKILCSAQSVRNVELRLPE